MRWRVRKSRSRRALGALLLGLVAWLGCGAPEAGSDAAPRAPSEALASAGAARESARVAIAGRVFELEVALDPVARMRGLSGRSEIPDYGGMLFVLPQPQPFYLVMRDCPVPIGAAFLDSEGGVLAVAEMAVEPPRGSAESARAYEARLPRYGVPEGARMAVELKGGRLRELGLAAGARVVIADLEDLLRRAK